MQAFFELCCLPDAKNAAHTDTQGGGSSWSGWLRTGANSSRRLGNDDPRDRNPAALRATILGVRCYLHVQLRQWGARARCAPLATVYIQTKFDI